MAASTLSCRMTARSFGFSLGRSSLVACEGRLCRHRGFSSYVMAIDQGTTSSRAILFDKSGKIAGVHQQEFTQKYPQPGWTSHDPLEIMDSVNNCVQKVVEKVGCTAADVASIGITNQRETTVCWDRVTGKPLSDALVWLDLRTKETVHKLKAEGGQNRFRQVTGLPVATYFSAVKMRWLIDNVDAVREAVDSKRAMFGTIDSWLLYNLCEGSPHITDITNASRYMLMDLGKGQWSPQVCGEIGIPVETLPEIRSSAEIYGKMKSGALSGVPIAGCLGDQHAALLGHGGLDRGDCKNTYGTGCFMLTNTGTTPVPSTHGLLTTVAFKLGPTAPIVYAMEGAVACAGRTLQWFRDGLQLWKDAADTEAMAKSAGSGGGLTIVPAFSGLFAPYWEEDAKAVFVGASLYTTKDHFAYAALESVALQTVDIVDAKAKDLTEGGVSSLLVDGGMTHNAFFMQMQADLLNLEVQVPKNAEATALGAAFAAGLPVGFFRLEDAKGLIGEKIAFRPQMTQESREAAKARWKDAIVRSIGGSSTL